MAKFLALGFNLEHVVASTTSHPARAYGFAHVLGTLAVDREADLSILRLVDEPWTAVDSMGATLRANQGLEPVCSVRSGQVQVVRPATRPYGAGHRQAAHLIDGGRA